MIAIKRPPAPVPPLAALLVAAVAVLLSAGLAGAAPYPGPFSMTEPIGSMPYDETRDTGTDHGPNGRYETNRARVYRWANDCRRADDYYCQTMTEALDDSIARLYSEFFMDARDDWDRHSGFQGEPPGWASSRHNNPAKWGTGDLADRAGNPGGGGTGGAGGGLRLPFIDPAKWVSDALAGISRDIAAQINAIVGKYLTTLFALPAGLTVDYPLVADLWAKSLVVANILAGLLALAALLGWVGVPFLAMSRVDAREVLGRIVSGVLLANYSAWIARQLVAMTTALIGYLAGTEPLSIGAPSDGALATAIAGLVLAIATLFMAGVLWMRLVLIDVLLIVAPLALILWIHPRFERITATWWRLLLGQLVVQLLQVLTLRFAFNLAQQGFDGQGAAVGLGNVLLSIFAIAVALGIDKKVGQHTGGGTGGLVRLVALRAGLALASGGAGAAAGATVAGGRFSRGSAPTGTDPGTGGGGAPLGSGLGSPASGRPADAGWRDHPPADRPAMPTTAYHPSYGRHGESTGASTAAAEALHGSRRQELAVRERALVDEARRRDTERDRADAADGHPARADGHPAGGPGHRRASTRAGS